MKRDLTGLGALASPLNVSDVDRIDGPLMFINGVAGVGWDDYVEVILEAGERQIGRAHV